MNNPDERCEQIRRCVALWHDDVLTANCTASFILENAPVSKIREIVDALPIALAREVDRMVNLAPKDDRGWAELCAFQAEAGWVFKSDSEDPTEEQRRRKDAYRRNVEALR